MSILARRFETASGTYPISLAASIESAAAYVANKKGSVHIKSASDDRGGTFQILGTNFGEDEHDDALSWTVINFQNRSTGAIESTFTITASSDYAGHFPFQGWKYIKIAFTDVSTGAGDLESAINYDSSEVAL